MKRGRNILILLLVGSFFLAGASLRAAEKDPLVVASGFDLKSADPYMASGTTWDVAPLWSDRLLGRDPKTGEIKPHLAESWRQVNDLTLEIKLRRGIKFHNGEPFDAAAVKTTLEWYADPANKSFMLSYLDWVKRVDLSDSYTLRIHSKNPAPLALQVLTDAAPVYPSQYFKKAGVEKFGNEPVGTGPFRFVSWKKGSEMVFARNDEYFGGLKGKPRVKNLVVRIIPEEATRVAELMAGGVHVVAELSPEQIFFLQKNPSVGVAKVREVRTFFIFMDVTGKSGPNPFQKLKVRQAVAHAIDTTAILRDVTRGIFYETKTVVSPVSFGYESQVHSYPYNPEKAKSLLAEAGYPGGFETDLYGWREKSVAESIMGYLGKVGIKTRLKWYGGQWPALHNLIKAGKVPFGFQTWFSSVPDADRVLSLWFESKGELSHVASPELDKWLHEAKTTINPKARQELFSKVQKYMADQALAVPIMGVSRIFAYHRDLDYHPSDYDNGWYNAGWKK